MVAASTVSIAQNDKNSNNEYPRYEIESYKKDGIKWSKLTNTPLVLTNLKDPVTGSSAEEMALNWVSQNQRLLQVESISDLNIYAVRSGAAGHNVRLRQQVNGVDVIGAEIVVHISPRHEVTYVTNTFDPTVSSISTVATISESNAFKVAKENLGETGAINFQSAKLSILNDGKTSLVYKVVLETELVLGSWEILVDANSGEVLRKVNNACNHKEHGEDDACTVSTPPPSTSKVSGTGYVFDPDPLSQDQVAYGGNYVDGNDATNATLDAARSNVTLLDITFNGSEYELVGPYAVITDFENPKRGLFAQATSDFLFNRNDAGFEAVNCYYHLDKALRYINETLSIPLMPFQYSGGMQFDPHGLNGQDNSYYLGGSGQISFGEGCVDDAEDADVILHELGHGLHDWLTSGNLSQVNGLSEGCGDYWSTSYSISLNQWTNSDPAYYWVFSWDGHNSCWGGRTTNYGATYPGGLTGSIHTDGQIWSSALIRIYEQIGRTKVDKAFLEGLAMTGSNTSQEDAAIAVRQAAIDMGYSCADVDVFTTEFTTTGYNMPALTAPSGSETSTICEGEFVEVNGNIYDANNPTGVEVIPGGSPACDSTVTINLTILPAATGSETGTICEGESITVNGTVYDMNNPTGTEVFAGVTANGCDSTVTVNLTVQTIDGTVTNDGATLTSNQNGATYQWLDCDNGNAAISGATNQSYTPSTAGNYAVEISMGSCSEVSSCEMIANSAGIDDVTLSHVSIYPNPSNGVFKVEIKEESDIQSYSITTVDGKLVKASTNIVDNQFKIDLSKESKGVYFLQFSNNSVIRLIVE